MTFEPFTYRGHDVRPGRHVRSENEVEFYKGAKNKRLTDEDVISVVNTPQAARTMIDALVALEESISNAHSKFDRVRKQFEDENRLDWFRFGTDESGGPLADDDEER